MKNLILLISVLFTSSFVFCQENKVTMEKNAVPTKVEVKTESAPEANPSNKKMTSSKLNPSSEVSAEIETQSTELNGIKEENQPATSSKRFPE